MPLLHGQVWIFEADVTMEQGPLTYVPGSQRNTKEKLEWMYAYSLPPATEALVCCTLLPQGKHRLDEIV